MNDTKQPNHNSILLAVDGSSTAKAAAYAATQMATVLQWGINALYVVDVTQVFEPYGNTSKELSELGDEIPHEQKISLFKEQGSFALMEIEDICQQMHVPLTTEILFGGVPDIILQASKGYNLLAIGRRGNR